MWARPRGQGRRRGGVGDANGTRMEAARNGESGPDHARAENEFPPPQLPSRAITGRERCATVDIRTRQRRVGVPALHSTEVAQK